MFGENNNGGFYMPVAPAAGYGYGNNGGGLFGGDGWGFLWLIALMMGWGGFGGFGGAGMMWPMMMGGGMGGVGLDYLYPWLNNSQNINGGFRDQQLQTSLGTLQNVVTAGFGDVQNSLCGVNAGIANAAAQAEISANARQMVNMQQLFGIQSAQQQCCCENRAAIADTKYTIATEACSTRQTSTDNTQKILDKLCQLELDGVRQNAETRYAALEARYNQALAENQALRFEKSQTAQNGFIEREIYNQNETFYNRLQNCPIPATPVYGRTPIFTCNGQNGCGCN